MLVLTRKRAESIKIGEDIVIKVIQTGRGTVKLGIEAPAHIRVLRAELTEFATAPVSVAIAHADGIGAETEAEGDMDSMSDDESHFGFSTEYAVEIEDQMLCVVG